MPLICQSSCSDLFDGDPSSHSSVEGLAPILVRLAAAPVSCVVRMNARGAGGRASSGRQTTWDAHGTEADGPNASRDAAESEQLVHAAEDVGEAFHFGAVVAFDRVELAVLDVVHNTDVPLPAVEAHAPPENEIARFRFVASFRSLGPAFRLEVREDGARARRVLERHRDTSAGTRLLSAPADERGAPRAAFGHACRQILLHEGTAIVAADLASARLELVDGDLKRGSSERATTQRGVR